MELATIGSSRAVPRTQSSGEGRREHVKRPISLAKFVLLGMGAGLGLGVLWLEWEKLDQLVVQIVAFCLVGAGILAVLYHRNYNHAYRSLPLRENNPWYSFARDGAGAVRRDSNVDYSSLSMEDKIESVLDTIDSTRDETHICEILCSSATAQELVEFKHQLDSALRKRGSSLYELVFYFFGHGARQTFLLHVEKQQSSQAGARVFVLSDMDDTLVSTFKDMRFPFNTVYPGVQEFYHQLILCTSEQSARPYLSDWSAAKDQVTFVTARPVWLNLWTRHDLAKNGFGTSVALTGSYASFVTPSLMLSRKINQCREMRSLFPEGVFFLVGDNGQRTKCEIDFKGPAGVIYSMHE